MVVVERLQRTAIVCYILRREKNFRYFDTWTKCFTTNLFLTTSVEANMDCFEIKLKIWSIYYTITVQTIYTYIIINSKHDYHACIDPMVIYRKEFRKQYYALRNIPLLNEMMRWCKLLVNEQICFWPFFAK